MPTAVVVVWPVRVENSAQQALVLVPQGLMTVVVPVSICSPVVVTVVLVEAFVLQVNFVLQELARCLVLAVSPNATALASIHKQTMRTVVRATFLVLRAKTASVVLVHVLRV